MGEQENELKEQLLQDSILNSNINNTNNSDFSNENKDNLSRNDTIFSEININKNESEKTVNLEQDVNPSQEKSNIKITISKKLDFYKPFQSPPDFELAQKHLKAKRVGIIDYKSWRKAYNQSEQCCQCCSLPYIKKPYGLCCDTNDFKFLGFGVSKYFDYIMYQLVSLIIVIAITGIYTYSSQTYYCLHHYQQGYGKYSENPKNLCIYTFFGIIFSFHGSQDNYRFLNQYQAYLNLVANLFTIIYLLFMTRSLNNQSLSYEKRIILPSQYTLMAYNIDPQMSEHNLKEMMADMAQIPIEQIVRVVYTYKINDYIQDLEQQEKLINKQKKLGRKDFNQTLDKQGLIGNKIRTLQQDWEDLQDRIKTFEEELQDPQLNYKWKNNIAFITFNTKRVQKECHDKLKLNLYQKYKNLVFKEKRLYVKLAPEPLDMIWENLEISQQDKFKFRFRGKVVDFLMILISFAIVSVLTIIQGKYFKTKEEFELDDVNMYYSIGISISIGVSNILMALVNDYLVTLEKYNSYTQLTQSNAWTLSWMDFSNMAFVPTFLFFLGWLDTNQMIHNTLVMFISNTFLIPSMLLLNFPYLISKMRQRYLKKQGDKCKLNQQQAHAVFQDPTFMMERKYCVVNSSYLYSMFYAAIFPIGLVFGIIVLLYTYWVSKYNLVRHTQIPNSISDNIIKKMMHVAACGPLIFALGCQYNLLLNKEISALQSYTHNFINYVMIIVGSIFLLARKNILKLKIFRKKNTNNSSYQGKNKQFTDIKKHIGIDYDIANPIIGEYINDTEIKSNSGTSSICNTDGQQQQQIHPRRSVLRSDSNVQFLNYFQKHFHVDDSSNIKEVEIIEGYKSQDVFNKNNYIRPQQNSGNSDKSVNSLPILEKQNVNKRIIDMYNSNNNKNSNIIIQQHNSEDVQYIQDNNKNEYIGQSEIIQQQQQQEEEEDSFIQQKQSISQKNQPNQKSSIGHRQGSSNSGNQSIYVNEEQENTPKNYTPLRQQLRGYASIQIYNRRRQTSYHKALGLVCPSDNMSIQQSILNSSEISSQGVVDTRKKSSTLTAGQENKRISPLQQQQQQQINSFRNSKTKKRNISDYKNMLSQGSSNSNNSNEDNNNIQVSNFNIMPPLSVLKEEDRNLETSNLKFTTVQEENLGSEVNIDSSNNNEDNAQQGNQQVEQIYEFEDEEDEDGLESKTNKSTDSD